MHLIETNNASFHFKESRKRKIQHAIGIKKGSKAQKKVNETEKKNKKVHVLILYHMIV
jgi:hypothetical protein